MEYILEKKYFENERFEKEVKAESLEKSKLEPGIDYYSDFYDTFGIEDPNFSIRVVKEKLKGLIEGGYIENFDDIALYNLFSIVFFECYLPKFF